MMRALRWIERHRDRLGVDSQWLAIVLLSAAVIWLAWPPPPTTVRIPPLHAAVELDADGVCTKWSQGMKALTEIPPERAIGTDLRGIIIPETAYERHREALREVIRKAERGEAVDEDETEQLVECYFMTPSGRRVDVQIRKRLRQDESGRWVAYAEFFEVVR